MKKILCIILTLITFLSFSFNSYASSYNNNIASPKVDIIKIDKGYELLYYNDTLIEDITTDEFRKIITKSGLDTSIYYEDFSTGIATLSVNDNIIETYNMNELRNNFTVWEMPKEDLELLENYFIQNTATSSASLESFPAEIQEKYTVSYDNEGFAVIRPTTNTTVYSVRAAENIVKPAGNVTDTYPEYTYREVNTLLRYSASCGRYLDMSIKDSMYGYTQTTNKSYTYAAGTVVSAIAGALKIASSTLLSSLTGLTTMVAGVLKLSSSIDYYFSESYKFYALRQACIYDYTYNNCDVSVYRESGTGEISMTWDYINNEYTNPSFRITAPAYPFTISYTTMYDTAQEVWEYNMEEHGYWKW